MIFIDNKCPHNKIYPFSDGMYCPDCGQEIKISWQILRCKACSSKRKSYFIKNKFIPFRYLTRIIYDFFPQLQRETIIPEEKFCKKCGCAEYFIDTREKIEFFDYEYAIILKEEIKFDTNTQKTTQIWVEEEKRSRAFNKQKLLPVF